MVNDSPAQLHALDGKRDGVASAEAERRDAAMQIAALQFVKQRDENARAASTDWMAERDRAAIHIDLRGIEAQLASDRNGCTAKASFTR